MTNRAERCGNAFAVTAFMTSMLVLLSVLAARPSGRFVVVVTDPFASPTQAIETIGQAGGTFVAGGRYPWITIAHSESDDFATRLFRAGAILVLNNWAAAGCIERAGS